MDPKHLTVNLKCKSKVQKDNMGENLDERRYASKSLKEIIGLY